MLHEIQEEGDDGGVDDIDKHRADDRYDEEGFDGIAVFRADGTLHDFTHYALLCSGDWSRFCERWSGVTNRQ